MKTVPHSRVNLRRPMRSSLSYSESRIMIGSVLRPTTSASQNYYQVGSVPRFIYGSLSPCLMSSTKKSTRLNFSNFSSTADSTCFSISTSFSGVSQLCGLGPKLCGTSHLCLKQSASELLNDFLTLAYTLSAIPPCSGNSHLILPLL